jgi:hypothetical protein
MGVDVDAVLESAAPSLRGRKTDTILLLGYPIPSRVGEPPSEVHWDAVRLPSLPAAEGKPPDGFRPNLEGWWRRDRNAAFADGAPLEHIRAESWSGERLQARGRFVAPLREARVAILGVGALGASVAEMLVRGGGVRLALVDGDLVASGNVCRHTSTLADVGRTKVSAVGKRLLQISPTVRITEAGGDLLGDPAAVVDLFDAYDAVVDCTASDDALRALAEGWWPMPRVFASFSLGYAARRLFLFGVTSNSFPEREFSKLLAPWLQDELAAWAGSDELLEGAGCWSPLFPARYDDVVMAAAACVKELEYLVSSRPRDARFRVFEKEESADGFQGFSLRRTPPAAASEGP